MKATGRRQNHKIRITDFQQFREAQMPPGARTINSLHECYRINVAHVDQLHALRVFLKRPEMIISNASAPHQGNLDWAISNWLEMMH